MDKDHPSSAEESKEPKSWIVRKWEGFTRIQKEWIASYEKRAFLILMGIILGVLLLLFVPKLQVWYLRATLDPCDINEIQPIERIQLAKDLAAAENSARLTIAQIIGGVVVLLGLYATFRNIEIARENHRVALDNLRITEEGKLTERFSKAVELLGSDKLDVRLGGIYALERIAQDSQKDHWTVMEVLTAFVREHSNEAFKKVWQDIKNNKDKEPEPFYIEQPKKRLRKDIQAALTVIGRRKWADKEKEHQRIDFSYATLVGARLYKAPLQKAIFYNTILALSDFKESQLNDADFTNANLRGAKLTNAELSNTKLNNADLRDAEGLTWEQISVATIDEKTKLPPELEERRKAEQAEQAEKAAAPNQ